MLIGWLICKGNSQVQILWSVLQEGMEMMIWLLSSSLVVDGVHAIIFSIIIPFAIYVTAFVVIIVLSNATFKCAVIICTEKNSHLTVKPRAHSHYQFHNVVGSMSTSYKGSQGVGYNRSTLRVDCIQGVGLLTSKWWLGDCPTVGENHKKSLSPPTSKGTNVIIIGINSSH